MEQTIQHVTFLGAFMKTDALLYRSIFIITEYYKNNLQPIFESLGEDVLWIGPAERQQIQGRDNLVEAFQAEKHDLTFTMGDITALYISPHRSVKEILLHYDIYTHYPSGNTDMHDQRLHYTWRENRVKTATGNEYRAEIAMIHISNAWKYDRRDTIYPVHYETVSMPVRFLTKPERYVTVKASDRNIHRIAEKNILYIETVKRSARLLLHTVTGTITINGTLPDFEKKYPDFLLRIHSSFLVNYAHVREICRFAVIMSDGTRLSVPEKKYTQIKKLLLQKRGE